MIRKKLPILINFAKLSFLYILISGCQEIDSQRLERKCANNSPFRNIKRTLEYCNKGILIDPLNPHNYNNRAVQKHALFDFYGAIEDSSKAIELRAQDTNDLAEHYYGRGTHYYAIQDLKGACLDWEKASQLRNRNAKTDFKKYCNSFIKIHER